MNLFQVFWNEAEPQILLQRMMVTFTEFSHVKLQGAALRMVSKLPQEFRKFLKNCYHLRRILRDTQKSLEEITAACIFPGGRQIF